MSDPIKMHLPSAQRMRGENRARDKRASRIENGQEDNVMRHMTAQLWRKSGWRTLAAALLMAVAGRAHAQLPVFDTIDWVGDRGGIATVAVTGSPSGVNINAFRPGYNGYLITDPVGGPPSIDSVFNNNPGLAVPRWVFPRTSDLTTNPSTTPGQIIVDNATRPAVGTGLNYSFSPNDDPLYPGGTQFQDAFNKKTRFLPILTGAQGTYDPQQMPHMTYGPIVAGLQWQLPDILPGATDAFGNDIDYRSAYGGYSVNSSSDYPWNQDYAYTPAVHSDFVVTRSDGSTSPATDAELAALPGGAQETVQQINARLQITQLKAIYSMGAYNAAAGNYAVDVHMPGSGTLINGTYHPSVSRAFVRVSWGTSAVDGLHNTVTPSGSFSGWLTLLSNSRVYMVNMQAGGWFKLAAPGQTEAAFPYDGTPGDQLVVTIYTLTPDDVNPGSGNPQNYDATPLVTADAVRFRPISNSTSGGLGLGTIGATGQILAPVAATSKLNNAFNSNIATTEKLPLIYFAREETIPDTSVFVPQDPNLPVDPNQYLPSPPNPANTPNPNYNPLIPDVTATKTVPVFYCLDNQNGDALLGGVQITSIDKVRWRYVGLPDTNNLLIDGSNVSVASPLIANVRCRDGAVRPMVYFVTSSSGLSNGRIYAFDPVGDRTKLTTDLYWVYPSYRPIQVADDNTNAQFAAAYYQYHDPNYKNASAAATAFGLKYDPGTYPVTSFGAAAVPDQVIGADHYYDGEVSQDPSLPGFWNISANRSNISGMGGITASPLLIDDPGNSTGPQMLIVPSNDGRVYAFDAGGRGDYSPISGATPLPGTTQRIWTYPHFGADAYHFLGRSGVNTILDDTGKQGFAQTPAYDPNYVNNNLAGDPFILPALDGYVYAINPIRDSIGIPNVNGSQHANWNNAARNNWQYPANGANPLVTSQGLSDISGLTIFSATGGSKYVYFTAAGRVYCLPEVSLSAANAPSWIYPFTSNAPYPSDPNDTSTFDFGAMTPLAITQANLPGSSRDQVYVLDKVTASVLMLDAAATGVGTTTLRATGGSITGSMTTSAPIITQLQTQYDYSIDGNIGVSQPAIVFGDSAGALWGLRANPETISGVPTLSVIWSQFDSALGRDANLVLANGMLFSGSEDGQLRAYGVGTGPNQDGSTLGTGEPPQARAGVGSLSIDLRTVNLYTRADFNAISLGPTANPPAPGPPSVRETPLRDESGNAYSHTANPATSNVTGDIYAADWGDYLYISAAGIYHAHPQDNTKKVFGNGAPTINVVFTLTQPNAAPITIPASGSLRVSSYYPGGVASPAGWPDDNGLTGGEHNNLKIYGLGSDDGVMKTLTGPTDSVYPWVAKVRVLINPSTRSPFAPGTAGYKVTAQASIEQAYNNNGSNLDTTNYSNFLSAGQTNWSGFDLTPSLPGGGVPIANPSRLTASRNIGITNPIGLTVRSYTGDGSIDLTGTNNHNIIGWVGSVNRSPSSIGEILGNGNRQSVTGNVAASSLSPIKDVFAPLGLLSDGSAATYQAINGSRKPVNAIFLTDRSAISRYNGSNGGLKVQVVTQPPHWYGGPSSVMNPLPWEQLPNNNLETTDYPSLNDNALTITNGSGQDAIHSTITLAPPIFHDKNPTLNPDPDTDVIRSRKIQPSAIQMKVQVPKYQPANVNRGYTSGLLPDGSSFNFGQGYVGISGLIRGGNLSATNDPVLGPIQTTTGDPVNPGDALAFPAAGYTSQMQIRVIPPNTSTTSVTNIGTARLQLLLGRNGSNAIATSQEAHRDFDMGLTVAPSVRMRVLETTVDVGKLPHGTGYSDFTAGAFRIPFSPTGSKDAPLLAGAINTPAPWDDPDSNTLGQFFRPFTVISDSNINLVNPRVAKLVGVNGAAISAYAHTATAVPTATQSVALRLNSDQVNNLSVSPLVAAAFGTGAGVGNIGIVSTLDHISLNNNPSVSNPYLIERSMWPIVNPYVYGNDIVTVNNLNKSLISTNALNLGVVGWADGVQPQPVVSKPRPGDPVGHQLTVPDKPHDAPEILTSLASASGPQTVSVFTSPKIGLAIPVGTPVGTYSADVNIFEDNTPAQWREWLAASAGYTSGVDNDNMLNITASGSLLETHTDPTFRLKAAVRESRLTQGWTTGTLPQVDLPVPGGYSGANTLPAVWMAPGTVAANLDPRQMWMYWSTNRSASNTPAANAQWTLAASSLAAPYTFDASTYPAFSGDFNFANSGPNATWWTNPTTFIGYGTSGPGTPATTQYLFPSTTTDQNNATIGLFKPPFLTGDVQAQTMRLTSPAVAPSLDLSGGYGLPNANDKEAYLFWQGSVDKTNTGTNSNLVAVTDTRTFWQPVGTSGGIAGAPQGPTFSLMNDPSLAKRAPKPLLVKLPARNGFPAQKFLFLFWHAGSGSNTQLYYNVASSTNLNQAFTANPWGTDTQLPLPGSLTSQSDAAPVYRHVVQFGQTYDCIDVAFTGTLAGRKRPEILYSRYVINRSGTGGTGGTLGALSLQPFPYVTQEVLSRVGTSNTFASRDAFWQIGNGVNGTLLPSDTIGSISIDYIKGTSGTYSHLNRQFVLDPVSKAVTSTNVASPQIGKFDPASGLITYEALSMDDTGVVTPAANGLSGGQVVVDTRSGTVTFPQVAPLINDTVLASYQPYVMRFSSSRDDTNIYRPTLAVSSWANDPVFAPRPAVDSPGSNTTPVVVLDRGPNPRYNLHFPQVVFNSPSSAPELDRMWVLYRKNDPSGTVKSTIYYKSMRLMVKLPRPMALGAADANGNQQLFAAPTVALVGSGSLGPYEVDWVRGRIYFTEIAEGRTVRISYSYYNPATNSVQSSGNLVYTVAWGDEMSSTQSNGDETVAENPLPTDQAVSEGTVAAFKDPYLDKLWVFWTSTRSNTTDLYYETIAPQFYSTASNQR